MVFRHYICFEGFDARAAADRHESLRLDERNRTESALRFVGILAIACSVSARLCAHGKFYIVDVRPDPTQPWSGSHQVRDLIRWSSRNANKGINEK
jgi:hypothetical protein